MIKFTDKGIYADTEVERQEFYRQMDAGDPMIMAHLALYKKELEDLEAQNEQ